MKIQLLSSYLLNYLSCSYHYDSRSENFRDDEYTEKMANDWTPETGFHSDELKKHKDGYPRPALGIKFNGISQELAVHKSF